MSPRRRAVVAALLAAPVLAGCSRLLFLPMERWVRTPADVGLDYRDVALRTADGTALSAWWLPARGAPRGTVLFLHGNAENISTHLRSVAWLPDAGYQVLLLDYRGYGRSDGRPTVPAVFDDLRTAAAWLAAEPAVGGRPVFLLGQSLGAALGGYLAGAEAGFRALFTAVVLDSGFARYRDIAREVAARGVVTWPLQWPIAAGMPDGYDPVDQVARLSPVPLLLIHGTSDGVVGYHHAQALFAAAREPRFLLSYDGPHIAAFEDAEIRAAVLRFFADPANGRNALAAASG
jgi:alpha-beta hydrolase superfamily lysophospholipase